MGNKGMLMYRIRLYLKAMAGGTNWGGALEGELLGQDFRNGPRDMINSELHEESEGVLI